MRATDFRDEGKYLLLGHSLGGYVSSNFALRFPEAIEKVLLVSAVGITPRPTHMTTDAQISRQPSAIRRQMFRFVRYLWNQNIAAFSIIRKCEFHIARRMLRGFVTRRINIHS
jgi:cardiolipin-specific phospholipase